MISDPNTDGGLPRGGIPAPQAPIPGQPQQQAPNSGYGQTQPGPQGAPWGYGQPHPGQPYQGQPHPGQSQPPASYATAPNSQGGPHTPPKNEFFDFTNYRFRMPVAWPKNIKSATPSFRKGIGSVVQTAHMPMDARIGYWIWLIGSVLTIVAWLFSIMAIAFGILINPFVLVATGMVGIFGGIRWGMVLIFVATMLFALVLMLVQLFMTLKIREGAEWARIALTALTLVTIVYSVILTIAGLESGGGGTVVINILSFFTIALFWLPKANEWFLRTTDENLPPPGSRRASRH